MTFKGVVKNGHVELNEVSTLPEGTFVDVQPSKPAGRFSKPNTPDPRADDIYSLGKRAVRDPNLPTDLASELDHYIYGTPKRKKARAKPSAAKRTPAAKAARTSKKSKRSR